jgi:hypothetical protein
MLVVLISEGSRKVAWFKSDRSDEDFIRRMHKCYPSPQFTVEFVRVSESFL